MPRRSRGRLLVVVIIALGIYFELQIGLSQGMVVGSTQGESAEGESTLQGPPGESKPGQDVQSWRSRLGAKIAGVGAKVARVLTPRPEAQKRVPGLLAFNIVVVCFLVARTQPPPSLPPLVAAPLEKRPDFSAVLVMSAVLSALSGMVNVVAILEMGMPVAHMTGNTSHTGRLIGIDSLRWGMCLLGFVFGSGVAGYNKCDGETLFAGRYSPGLLSAAIAVVGGTMIQWKYADPFLAVPLFAFSQGMQNSITRRFKGLPVCTTHITGYLTDLGRLSGNWARARWTGTVEPLPSLKRPFFFFVGCFAFGLGGFIAKRCRDRWGVLAAMVPAAVMALTSLGHVTVPELLTMRTKKS